MSRLRWPDSTNSVSEKPGTIHTDVDWTVFDPMLKVELHTHTADDPPGRDPA